MVFLAEGVVLGIILICTGLFVARKIASKPELWKRLPREKVFGSVLGVGCLIWSAHHANALFEGGLAQYQGLLYPFTAALCVACFIYLDYIFTRALGGMLLLCSNHLLQSAFAAEAPCRGLLALVCYILGLCGIVMIAKPFAFRDLLDRLAQDERCRRNVAMSLMASGVITATISILQYVL